MPDFSTTFNPEKFFQPLLQFLKIINDYMYLFFQYGNLILFLSSLIMGILLLFNAREIEYDEKIHNKIEMVKRRGRIGAAIYILIAFLFLSGILARWLFKFFSIFPKNIFSNKISALWM